MAKKKTGKEIKRLKKKAKRLNAANLTLGKKIRKLEKKLDARMHQIADLRAGPGGATPIAPAVSTSIAEIGEVDGGGVASNHRAIWKQHKFLRDKYELHLSAGATKQRARQLANDDLQQEFGTDAGFSEEQLGAILS